MSDSDITLVPVDSDNYEYVRYLHVVNFNESYDDDTYEVLACGVLLKGFLAYCGDCVAGEVCIQWDYRCGLLCAYIVSISVLEEYRRRGIGSMLMEKVIDECKAANAIFLHTRVSNYSAQHLYGKYGFQKKSYSYMYYGNESAVIMRRLNDNPEESDFPKLFEELGYEIYQFIPFPFSRDDKMIMNDIVEDDYQFIDIRLLDIDCIINTISHSPLLLY